jgi:HK97 family phage prohead protease
MTDRKFADKPKPVERSATIEKDDSAPRRIRFVASDESVDRYGDIIRAAGWQLDNFRKNPVLLFGHQSRSLPVGKVDPIGIEGTRLIAHAEFPPEGVSPFADTVAQMVDKGFLSAVSVGFMPLATPTPIFDENKSVTGFEYNGQELLELSVVPVPANPNALALARSFSLSEEDTRRLFVTDVGAARRAAQQRSRLITLARLRRPA